MTDTIIKQLAAEISVHIAPEIPVSVAYWDLGKIAACLSYGKTKARQLTTRLDFPRPVRPGGTGDKRWRAKDVLEWVETFRDREAKL